MQADPDSKLCELCHLHILAKCYDIHKRACEKKNGASIKHISAIKQESKDLIPCSECGEMVSFSIYGVHIQECVGRQLTKCHQCKLLYPTFLIDQHLTVCNTFREEAEDPLKKSSNSSQKMESQQMNEMFSEEEEDYQMDFMIMQLAANMPNQDEPLTVETVTLMPKKITQKAEQCSICYCPVPPKTQILRLSCPHAYHLKCITAWVQKNPHCPMCRKYVLS